MVHTEKSTKVAGSELPDEDLLLDQLTKTAATSVDLKWTTADVDRWLSNFSGEVFEESYERHLALFLLSNFVYYDQEEVRHLCSVLLRRFLHQNLPGHMKGGTSDEVNDAAENFLSQLLFYQIGRPGESGGFILYFFRQANDLPHTSFVTSPDLIPEGVDTICFIDDVCLSGGQTKKYFEGLAERFIDYRRVVLALVATDMAARELRELDVDLTAAITLDSRSQCFSENSDAFSEHRDHMFAAKKLAKHYGSKISSKYPLGYKDGEFAFGFFFNTPNNTLPIFWSEKNGWHPIMRRYGKKYSGEVKFVSDAYL